jgi:hypothetical protein
VGDAPGIGCGIAAATVLAGLHTSCAARCLTARVLNQMLLCPVIVPYHTAMDCYKLFLLFHDTLARVRGRNVRISNMIKMYLPILNNSLLG